MVGKMVTAGMIGFVIGMKLNPAGKQICMKKLKRQAMKKIGLA